MKVLYVVQRYGREVAGGAEAACREVAEQMAAAGHEVHVLTSTAVDYTDWANHFPPVDSEIDGVHVHRLAVRETRDSIQFTPLNELVVLGDQDPTPVMQRRWMAAQGPRLTALPAWLRRNAASFDVIDFFTYLYHPTWVGLPIAAALAPTILHPTAHDEPPFHLPLFDEVFGHATGFAFFTPEERDLLERRMRRSPLSEVVGIGVDPPAEPGVPQRFRERFGLGDRPYLLFLGRVDPGKGSDEVERFFRAYKERNPGPLALVIMGQAVTTPEEHEDVIVTGFVDEATKSDGLAGATIFVQPSYFESFSIALVEAWLHGVPALVQGHTDVLVGQARRSGGAIPYLGFAEFEAAVDLLLEDDELRSRLGEAGRRYAEAEYGWEPVLHRYAELIDRVRRAWERPGVPVAARLAGGG
jgi:glycosyltransferase involved in cell wall biosynthesis